MKGYKSISVQSFKKCVYKENYITYFILPGV